MTYSMPDCAIEKYQSGFVVRGRQGSRRILPCSKRSLIRYMLRSVERIFTGDYVYYEEGGRRIALIYTNPPHHPTINVAMVLLDGVGDKIVSNFYTRAEVAEFIAKFLTEVDNV